MKRAHELPLSKDIVFVDSTSSCDPQNHCITFLLTPCAAGAAPLGVICTQGQSEEAYYSGFDLIKNNLKNAFGGQGYPKIFLTDNSAAEINALKSVWPKSTSLLCIFHVMQAVWRWLWDSKNNINKDHRTSMMQEFRQILYADTIEEALQAFNFALNQRSMYSKWQKYISQHWEHRKQWCLAWREYTIRGHHTNNFSEVSVRIFKENVLCRVKAYNVISLVDFCCTKLEDYYKKKFQEFSNDRNSTARLYFEKVIKKCDYVKKEDVIEENKIYYVPSESDKQMMYSVEPTIGVCSCKDGMHGKFCKHQGVVFKFYNEVGVNFPSVTVEDKYLVSKLALGDKTPKKTFFEGLLSSEALHNHNEIMRAPIEEIEILKNNQTEHEETTNDSLNYVTKENVFKQQLTSMHDNSSEILHTQDSFSVLEEITNQMSVNVKKFSQSTYENLLKFKDRLNRIKTEGQFNSFLATAGTRSIPLRYRDGSSINVQPTTICRRKPGVTRGSKRLPSGNFMIREEEKIIN